MHSTLCRYDTERDNPNHIVMGTSGTGEMLGEPLMCAALQPTAVGAVHAESSAPVALETRLVATLQPIK
jgi:hypothetical protein